MTVSLVFKRTSTSTSLVFGEDSSQGGGIFIRGHDSQVLSDIAVSNVVGTIAPAGTPPGEFGQPMLSTSGAPLYMAAAKPVDAYGTLWISQRVRKITATLGDQAAYGAPAVTHSTRTVSFDTRGFAPAAYGSLSINYAIVTVYPAFISSSVFGTPAIRPIQYVAMESDTTTDVFGAAELTINDRRVYMEPGIPSGAAYGAFMIDRRVREVSLYNKGFDSSEVSAFKVHNLTQQVTVDPYSENTQPDVWSTFYPHVENKDRSITPTGAPMARVGAYFVVENGAVAVPLQGLDATLWGEGTFVAYRDRSITPESWEDSYSTRYHIVRNNAVVVAPSGVSAPGVGAPSALNLNREVRMWSPDEMTAFGTTFTDYAIRGFNMSPTYGMGEVPAPDVRHNPHPIAPTGVAPEAMGWPILTVHFNTVEFHSTNVHDLWAGDLTIVNRNKNIPMFGPITSEFGRPTVRNFIQNVTGEGVGSFAYGAFVISDRTKRVYVAPFSAPSISTAFSVRKDSPDPPSPQIVVMGDAGAGDKVGQPSVRANSVFPSGFVDGKYGTPTVELRGVRFTSLFEDQMFGTPTFIFTQSFSVAGVEPPEQSSGMRFSPFTMYLPSGEEAPRGYNPTSPFQHVVNGRDPTSANGSRFPCFGDFTVANKHRVIGPVPTHYQDSPLDSYPRFGEFSVALRRRYISPLSIKATRFGWIVYWGVPQTIDFGDNGVDASATFGNLTAAPPAVDPDSTRYIAPGGVAGTSFGATRVELFNRVLSFQGIPHRGNPEQSMTSPWGVPLIGFPRKYSWGLGDLTLFGTPWVDFKVRSVAMEGEALGSHDSLQYDDFVSPLKVTRTNPYSFISGAGDSQAFGKPKIEHIDRGVSLVGVSGYNPSMPRVHGENHVAVVGGAFTVFGNVDRWEEGKIKGYGSDLSVFGDLAVARTVALAGGDQARLAAISVATVVALSSVPPAGGDTFTATNLLGCRNRAIAMGSTPAPQVSAPALEEA